MIVEHRQGVAAFALGGEVPFEVHLPEFVGCGTLEACNRFVLAAFRRVDRAVATQNLRDRRWRRRQLDQTLPFQDLLDLAAAPLRMGCPYLENRRFYLRPGSLRRAARPS